MNTIDHTTAQNTLKNRGSPLVLAINEDIDDPTENLTPKANGDSYKLLPIKYSQRRAVFKNGYCNVNRAAKFSLKHFQNCFTAFVHCRWRWTILVFCLAFFMSWLLFAVVWYIIALTHGDLEEEHLPHNQKKNNWRPCVTAIESFTSAFLYSVETQHTTGYGIKLTTEECPQAIITMCIQSIVGLIIDVFMVGIVFAKMTRAKMTTLHFSTNAVINKKDGYLTLMFRLGDLDQKSHIIGANITAYLIHSRQTKEGDILKNHQSEITVHADDCKNNIFLVWPLTIAHRIDKNSPFYNICPEDLLEDTFEIVLILEGTIASTGQPTQVRSSYLSSEILWGRKFEPIVYFDQYTQSYKVNNSKFNSTFPVATPLFSAADMNEMNTLPAIGKNATLPRSPSTSPT